MNTDFYSLKIKSSQGEIIDMCDFKGKTVLIINTATKCGFAPQFKGLETLYQKYKDKGLVVIGFPCNQFQNQEPETNETMKESCELNFGVTFTLTEIIDVNGKNTHPVFKFLKGHLRGLTGKRIKWNFTKFLITSEGKPYKRFAPTVQPQRIEKSIKALLKIYP